jgi:putative transposase
MNSGTYTQIYIHLVFAVKNRESVLIPSIQEEVFKFIAGTINSMKHKSLAVNGMTDHIHCFLGLYPMQSISELVKEVKRSSTNLINQNKWLPGKFEWQTGFGGFSYSRSQIDSVIKYIVDQKIHHKKQTFKDEYFGFLKKFQVEYNPDFLFKFFE